MANGYYMTYGEVDHRIKSLLIIFESKQSILIGQNKLGKSQDY